jgi:hypothetical protein
MIDAAVADYCYTGSVSMATTILSFFNAPWTPILYGFSSFITFLEGIHSMM